MEAVDVSHPPPSFCVRLDGAASTRETEAPRLRAMPPAEDRRAAAPPGGTLAPCAVPRSSSLVLTSLRRNTQAVSCMFCCRAGLLPPTAWPAPSFGTPWAGQQPAALLLKPDCGLLAGPRAAPGDAAGAAGGERAAAECAPADRGEAAAAGAAEPSSQNGIAGRAEAAGSSAREVVAAEASSPGSSAKDGAKAEGKARGAEGGRAGKAEKKEAKAKAKAKAKAGDRRDDRREGKEGSAHGRTGRAHDRSPSVARDTERRRRRSGSRGRGHGRSRSRNRGAERCARCLCKLPAAACSAHSVVRRGCVLTGRARRRTKDRRQGRSRSRRPQRERLPTPPGKRRRRERSASASSGSRSAHGAVPGTWRPLSQRIQGADIAAALVCVQRMPAGLFGRITCRATYWWMP